MAGRKGGSVRETLAPGSALVSLKIYDNFNVEV
jgi:hypothetical protein